MPGAAVQIQMKPVWSTTKSPSANVPGDGWPPAVAPTYLLAAVAPVSPLTVRSAVDVAPLTVRSAVELLGTVGRVGCLWLPVG